VWGHSSWRCRSTSGGRGRQRRSSGRWRGSSRSSRRSRGRRGAGRWAARGGRPGHCGHGRRRLCGRRLALSGRLVDRRGQPCAGQLGTRRRRDARGRRALGFVCERGLVAGAPVVVAVLRLGAGARRLHLVQDAGVEASLGFRLGRGRTSWWSAGWRGRASSWWSAGWRGRASSWWSAGWRGRASSWWSTGSDGAHECVCLGGSPGGTSSCWAARGCCSSGAGARRAARGRCAS